MGSPALLYWASALAEQEAARIRAECSNVTDGPGGVQSLTLFSPHFSSCSPLMCAFKPSCLLQLNVHFIFWPPPLSPHHVVPIMVSYIFPLNHQRVCALRWYVCIHTYFCRNSICSEARVPELTLCTRQEGTKVCFFLFFLVCFSDTHCEQ